MLKLSFPHNHDCYTEYYRDSGYNFEKPSLTRLLNLIMDPLIIMIDCCLLHKDHITSNNK
jgi:hypothetical protein